MIMDLIGVGTKINQPNGIFNMKPME